VIATGHNTSLADLSVRLSRQIQKRQEGSPGTPIQQANEELRILGRVIRRLRLDLGMTVPELTTRARVSDDPLLVYELEGGLRAAEQIDSDTLVRIAAQVGIDLQPDQVASFLS